MDKSPSFLLTDHQGLGSAIDEQEWPTFGAVDIDEERMLILWESSWVSSDEYHALRANGHKGWLEYSRPQDRLLVSWEPTIENKRAQSQPQALLTDFAIETRRYRPGLLGYVAAKYLEDPLGNGKHLAFLAYWKTVPVPKGQFTKLQQAFLSHQGRVVHSESEHEWIQWEPTWVYYNDLDIKKKHLLYRMRHDEQALLDCFHKKVVHHSTIVPVKKRLSWAQYVSNIDGLM